MRIRLSQVFFGWWTVLAGSVLTLWGFGYYNFGISALFKPIASDLGLTRAATSTAVGIGRLVNGPTAVVSGWLSDRFGPRGIVLFGVLLTGLGLNLMYFVRALWSLYLVWGVILGMGVSLGLMLPLDKAITNWFIRKRGAAMSVRAVSGGLSGVLVLPLIAWLISTREWRITCLIGGVVMWVVGLPLAWFFIRRHRPEYYGLLPDGGRVADESQPPVGAVDEEAEFTLRQAIRTPSFWLLIGGMAGFDLLMPALSVHGIPLVTDIGVAPVKAAGLLAIVAAFAMVGTFISGFLVDRVKREHLRFLVAGSLSVPIVGTGIFLLNQSLTTIYVWFILTGLGGGALPNLVALTRGHYFGRRNFGTIHGISMLMTPPFAVVAPIYAGWVYDTQGSYLPAFTVLAGLLFLFALAMPFARPPKPPVS